MPQIQFPIPGSEETEEMTGISLGEHGGVESFIVVGPAGHLSVRSKAVASEADSADTPAVAKPIK
jgi:hypothetical protein